MKKIKDQGERGGYRERRIEAQGPIEDGFPDLKNIRPLTLETVSLELGPWKLTDKKLTKVVRDNKDQR